MTVLIGSPTSPAKQRKMAVIAVERELKGHPSYCAILKDLAIEAVHEYHPAYVRGPKSFSDDQATGCALTWAMGGLLGVAIDPPAPLRGLRAVLNWRQGEMPAEEFDRWMRHVLRNVRPVNAMALIDREILMTERGLKDDEVCHV